MSVDSLEPVRDFISATHRRTSFMPFGRTQGDRWKANCPAGGTFLRLLSVEAQTLP